MELDLDLNQSEVKYAGFWIRFLAFIIDSVVFCLVLAIPFAFLFDGGNVNIDLAAGPQALEKLLPLLQQMLMQNAVLLLVYVFFWVKFFATPAKLILGLQIVDANTLGALSIARSIVRYLGYFVALLPFGLGFIWVGLDAKKRGFHDLMAGSVVIYKPK